MAVAMATDQSPGYVIGEPHGNRNDHATVETKPSVHGYTGGGYEHARSVEHRPHTPGTKSEDVYASIHRLCAVAWCYPDDMPTDEVLDDLRTKDVHHTLGVPWANIGTSPNFDESGIDAVDHGRHAEITNTQRRAWAEDAKRDVEATEQQPLGDAGASVCGRCGEAADTEVESDEWDGVYCIECSKDVDPDGPIRVRP